MMGFGSFGGGAPSPSPSPSSSNLSALAPPFTVDRSNSKPSTASLLQFPESSYATTSFGHTWHYANPPVSEPLAYQKSELETDSTIITPVTSANDYHFKYCASSSSDNKQSNHWSTLNPCSKTATDAFSFDPKLETYYPHYVSPVVDDGTPLVPLNDSSYDVLSSSGLLSANASVPVDYTRSLSGLEYNPNWGGGGACYGVVNAKRGKHAKLDGSSFVAERSSATDAVAYTSYLNQGKNTPEEGSSCSYIRFSDVVGRESSKHSAGMEHADCTSFLTQQVHSLPFDSSMTTISSSSFTTSESITPPGPSLQSPKNFPNYQSPYSKGNQLINSCSSTALSAMNSSPKLVIRPLPIGTGLAFQESSSDQAVHVDATSVHENAVGNKRPARVKEPHVLQNGESVDGSFYTSNIKIHKDETDKVFSLSPVVEGTPSKVQNKDTFSHVLRMNSGSQFLNVSASDGSSIAGDCIVAGKSSENLDCVDHHNLAVDSPCWKGAPSSHFVPFDAVENNSSLDLIKKLDECRLQVPPIRPPSVKVAKDRTQREYGSASQEQMFADIAKIIPSLTSSKGVQFCEEYSKAGEEYIQLKQAKRDSPLKFSDQDQLGGEGCCFDTKKSSLQNTVMDAMMSVNDPTEGAVAVRAAEDVLCSPSSEESATEQVKPHKSEAAPVMDVQTLIKTMKNLSDLLVFSCSSNQSLKEQDHEALKHVLCNLESLLSQRMLHTSQAKEWPLHLDNSENIVEYLHPHKCVSAGKPQLENKAPLELHGQPDYKQYCQKKKPASFQHLPSLMTDLDVLSDDNISQAIKKVLDENSYFGEEEHSQALLFKSLWLEAEAKLYSISYKARFDRMKIEMERLKVKQEKDVTGKISAPKESSKAETLPACSKSILASPEVAKVSTSKVAHGASLGNADDVQASSVLIALGCGDDPKPFNLMREPENEDIEASVMNRFHILKRRDDPSAINPAAGQEAASSGKLGSVDLVGTGYELFKDFFSVTDDSVTRSPGNSGKRTLYSLGSTDNSSSDWEHVLKEDISWR